MYLDKCNVTTFFMVAKKQEQGADQSITKMCILFYFFATIPCTWYVKTARLLGPFDKQFTQMVHFRSILYVIMSNMDISFI